MLLLLKLVALTAAAVAAPLSWISAGVVAEVMPPAAVDPNDPVVFLEGELFLEAFLDLEDRDEEVGPAEEDSRGFMSLPLLPWRIKFLSCSSRGAILCVYVLLLIVVRRRKDREEGCALPSFLFG